MREPVANQTASAVAEADEAWALKLLEELESEDQQTAHISEQHKQADILGLVQDDKSKGPER